MGEGVSMDTLAGEAFKLYCRLVTRLEDTCLTDNPTKEYGRVNRVVERAMLRYHRRLSRAMGL